jgi:hypothetical protein
MAHTCRTVGRFTGRFQKGRNALAEIARQWQELQLPPAHPEQEEPALPIRLLAAPLSPPLLKPKTDIIRCTSVESHLGQFTDSSLRKTNLSNCSQHLQHSYSKMGIPSLL